MAKEYIEARRYLSLDKAYASIKQDAEGRMRPIGNETGERVIRRIAV